jgi:hypothetical protein
MWRVLFFEEHYNKFYLHLFAARVAMLPMTRRQNVGLLNNNNND